MLSYIGLRRSVSLRQQRFPVCARLSRGIIWFSLNLLLWSYDLIQESCLWRLYSHRPIVTITLSQFNTKLKFLINLLAVYASSDFKVHFSFCLVLSCPIISGVEAVTIPSEWACDITRRRVRWASIIPRQSTSSAWNATCVTTTSRYRLTPR